ncbi:hypothetical protein [Halalkalibacter alkalisediminis]|uniref:Uncharacterized protein n=1 Tax=Halalkalibacter alkalisediminis TaxID=935616 RepID=A0ABV6NI95_9BACI|nr:hypothetical protein [Halalkalibacter alkalisediminis]
MKIEGYLLVEHPSMREEVISLKKQGYKQNKRFVRF